MGKIEDTSCDPGRFRFDSNIKRRWVTFLLLCLSCATASTAVVAVEFSGRVTFSQMGWRVGQRVLGYFTYAPDLPPGWQTSTRPNLVIETPENNGRMEFTGYDFYVYNNWSPDPFYST